MIKIAIIGSGVVGQATGKGFISRGFDVKFLDVNPLLVNNFELQNSASSLFHRRF